MAADAKTDTKSGMTLPEMKKLLNMASADHPINCAIGLGDDGPPLLLLHKMKQPRALEAEMKKENPKLKLIRFGTAVIDVKNQAQVNLSLNKPSAGMGKRLVKTLKGTGFTKVHIVAKDENGLEVAESAGDEEEAGGTASAPAQPEKKADAAPAQKDPRSATTVENAKKAWVLTLKKLEGDIEKLMAEMVKAYEGHGFADQLDKTVKAKIEPSLAKFDRELVKMLDGVINAKERGEQTKAVQAAHKKIQDYKAHLESDPLFKKLDANPFHKINVVQVASVTLTALDKAVSAML